ncbi:MAG: ABC transporter permease [Terriglobales bacterium]
MLRVWAIMERDLRKFLRSPALIMVATIFPLFQLVILGNAFGGNIKHIDLAVVNEDHGPQALRVWEGLQAIEATAATLRAIPYADRAAAVRDLRISRVQGVLVIPVNYSRDARAGLDPRLGLVEDNTDRFITGTLDASLEGLVAQLNVPAVVGREPAAAALAQVELYPYVDYMKYLLPGSVALAIFVTAMIGGGIIYIDDKARGLHEGYLVTPISKFELLLGFNLAGVVKAVLAGLALAWLGALLSGVPGFYHPTQMLWVVLMTVVSSVAFIAMMFLMMVRVSDPLVPRAIFGVLNTLLFFPSGAIYPIKAFPPWLRVLAKGDPFTYAVDGYRNLMLKQAGFAAIGWDLLFLGLFSVAMLGASWALFRRTL